MELSNRSTYLPESESVIIVFLVSLRLGQGLFKYLLFFTKDKCLRDKVNDVTHASQSTLSMRVLWPFVDLPKCFNSGIVTGRIIQNKTTKPRLNLVVLYNLVNRPCNILA